MEQVSPRVSVIVPIYNGAVDLPDLLDCLRSQTYPTEQVEYLLVDNNSGDRTPQLLQTASQTASQTAGHLTIIPLTEATIQSSYAARNTGIRAATADILAFTDADCRPQPQWLAELVKPFADPAVGFVVGEINALAPANWLERHSERQGVLSQKDTLAHPFYPYGQTANLAVRRQVFEQIGLFRPYLTTGGDADLCWRIQQQTDWQFVFAEQALVLHRHRGSFADLDSQWRRYGRSNKYLHQLHGVDLMQPISWQKTAYLLTRWLLKEVPSKSPQVVSGQAPWVDLISTPINLFCNYARFAGQQAAQLPNQAQVIDWFSQPPPAVQPVGTPHPPTPSP